MASALPLDALHSYAYGTGFWYMTRALARIYDPNMVYMWFSNERLDQDPSMVELYNLRTDAFGLALLALFTALLPSITAGHLTLFSSRSLSGTAQSAAVARLGLLGTMLHHFGTGVLAYAQWADVRTSTGAMLLGWVVSAGLTALGGLAYLGIGEGLKIGGPGGLFGGKSKKLRSGRKIR